MKINSRTTTQHRAYSSIASRYGRNARLPSLLKECFSSLLRTPPKSAFLICALALVIPALFTSLSSSFKSAQQNLLENRHITVFLNSQVTSDEAITLASNLAANNHIQSTVVAPITVSGKELLSVDIQPHVNLNNTELSLMMEDLTNHPTIDFVDADSAWLQDNVAAIKTTKILSLLSILLGALITAALAFGITYFDLLRHRSEYQTLNLLGASASTAMKPMLLRSLLLAFLALSIGTLLAWGLISTLPHLIDMSTYGDVAPSFAPFAYLAVMSVIAAISSLLAIKFVGNKTFSSMYSMG